MKKVVYFTISLLALGAHLAYKESPQTAKSVGVSLISDLARVSDDVVLYQEWLREHAQHRSFEEYKAIKSISYR